MPQLDKMDRTKTRRKGPLNILTCPQIETLNLSTTHFWPSSLQQTTQSVPYRPMDRNPNPNGGIAHGLPLSRAPQGFSEQVQFAYNQEYLPSNSPWFRNTQNNDASFGLPSLTPPSLRAHQGFNEQVQSAYDQEYLPSNPPGFRNTQNNDASFGLPSSYPDVTSPGHSYYSDSGPMDSFNTPTSSSCFGASPDEISQDNVRAFGSRTSQKPVTSFQDQIHIWDHKTGEDIKETGRKRPRTDAQKQHINEVKSWGGACDDCKAKHRKCNHPEAARSEKGASINKRPAPDYIGQQETVKRTKVRQSPNEPTSKTEFLQCVGGQFESPELRRLPAGLQYLDTPQVLADTSYYGTSNAQATTISQGNEAFYQQAPLSNLSVPAGLEDAFLPNDPWLWLDYPDFQ